MSYTHGPSVISQNLITYIDFGNSKSTPGTGTSPVTINNLTSSGNNWATQNGVTVGANSTTTDGTAGYIVYNGTANDLAWTPDGSIGTSNLTIEVAFNSSDTSGFIVSKPWNGGGNYNYALQPGSMSVRTSTNYGLGFSNICTGSNVHIAVVINNTYVYVYKNGVLLASGAHGIPVTNVTIDSGNAQLATLIGSLYPYGQGWAGNTGFSIAGTWYFARFYNRELSAAEVLRNFNATKGKLGL